MMRVRVREYAWLSMLMDELLLSSCINRFRSCYSSSDRFRVRARVGVSAEVRVRDRIVVGGLVRLVVRGECCS
jgi:hypothetical protein